MVTPVVAVMGHVDHGKTSLLDKIRNTNVALGEAGGITQSVRAHQIFYKSNNIDHKITFIDTPGHEAFSGMRSRGAKVANIAVVVVASNEGVKPQTVEAIKFALGEKIPIIIALSKIDMPQENRDKIISQLSQAGVVLEENGGDSILVPVSAKTGEGVDKLLETIILTNEIHNEKISIDETLPVLASGIVLESHLDRQLGAVALVILKKGELHIDSKSPVYASGNGFSSKLRSLLNVDKQNVDSLFSGDPIWVNGLTSVLEIGQIIKFFGTEKDAKSEMESIKSEEEYNKAVSKDPFAMFQSLVSKSKGTSEKPKLQVMLRADTKGSLEVAENEIKKLTDELAEIIIKDSKVGDVTESDISFAKNTKSIIIAFRSHISDKTLKLAMQEKVLVRDYEIVYEMIDELEGALTGLITKGEEEIDVAIASVKQVFKLSNGMVVAGSVIQKGTMLKGYRVRVERNYEEIGRGKIIELRVLKNEVKEVEKGKDCGIMIEPNLDLHDGDKIIAFKVEKL